MDGPTKAEGFEVVDKEGRVRARLGLLHEDCMGEVFGVATYDADGRERAWFCIAPTGPHLAFAEGGDLAVELGVADAIDPADATGPLFVIAAEDGTPVRVWPDVLNPGADNEEV